MLKALDTDIWVAEFDWFAMGIHFPGRMTVVRLANGSLWLFSPIPIDDSLAEELKALGTVTDVVAPNRFHHSHLAGVMERYPDARLYGVPGLPEKRKDLSFDGTLPHDMPDAWRGDFEQVFLQAVPAMSEVVFLHRGSGSLICADLFMNVHKVRGFLGWLVYWLEGCWKKPAVPRLIKFLTKDKEQMRGDLETIAAWPIRRLIMAHGDIVDENAADVVRAGFSIFGLPGAPKSAPA